VTPPPLRWPLHPQPGPLESLSSWVHRLAVTYGMTPKYLLGPKNLELGGMYVPYNLSYDPPSVILTELAKRTGVDLGQLKAMTLLGLEPCLFELSSYRYSSVKVFNDYIRDNSVLLAAGEVGGNALGASGRWSGPWHVIRRPPVECPVCAIDPDKGKYLVWELPLTLGCGEHGCYLETSHEIALHTLTHNQPLPPRQMPEPLATLERYTHSALITGQVDLPGRTVHAAIWFRLLRSLLYEVSLALTSRRLQSRATLEQVWEAAGQPQRADPEGWRTYEHLNPEQQKIMMLVAAAALDLAAKGAIVAQGRLASAIQKPRGQHVYDGDQPSRSAWQEAVDQAEVLLVVARTDPEAARQVLFWMTTQCRTIAHFEEQRAYLFGAGIPSTFLPTAAELGRADLI
jgi:hypothetical protein